MAQPHLCYVIAGFCLCICSRMLSQAVAGQPPPASPDHHPEIAAKDTAETPSMAPDARPWKQFWRTVHLSGGQLTVPFKIRPKKEHGTFRLTTDVTLGAYIGLTRRINPKKEHFLTVPITAGLTFININNDNTSLDLAASGTDVVPGLSWSSGIILQLEHFNVGLIFGKDYASEVGDQWIYHRKWWWSFGLGFSFLN